MSKNLTGKKIVVTRTRSQASTLAELLEDKGADVIEIPTIKTIDPEDKQEFVEGVTSVHTYDWLVFTSPNGVDRFFKAFYAAYADARSLGGCRIAAVGPGTAQKINEYRFAVDLMPDTYVAEELVSTFAERESIENLTVLWVRGSDARDVVQKGLSALGAIVDECIDAVTFASGSSVEHFFGLGLPWPKGAKAISIGPITTKALQAYDVEVIEAKESSLTSMVDAL